MPKNIETKPAQSLGFKVGDALWSNIFKKENAEQRSTLAIMKSVPIFTGMSKPQLREFIKIMHNRQFKKGEAIFYEGEPGVGMYVIQKGAVAITKGKGFVEKLAELSVGEFFGELALLDESPRSATATAVVDCQMIGLFRPDLFDLVERKPRLGNKLLFQLACLIGARLKRTNEELETVWARIEDAKVIS